VERGGPFLRAARKLDRGGCFWYRMHASPQSFPFQRGTPLALGNARNRNTCEVTSDSPRHVADDEEGTARCAAPKHDDVGVNFSATRCCETWRRGSVDRSFCALQLPTRAAKFLEPDDREPRACARAISYPLVLTTRTTSSQSDGRVFPTTGGSRAGSIPRWGCPPTAPCVRARVRALDARFELPVRCHHPCRSPPAPPCVPGDLGSLATR